MKLYKEKIERIKEEGIIYEQLEDWYKNKYQPEKSSLENEEKILISKVSKNNELIEK
jgi:hypothetical protein